MKLYHYYAESESPSDSQDRICYSGLSLVSEDVLDPSQSPKDLGEDYRVIIQQVITAISHDLVSRGKPIPDWLADRILIKSLARVD